MLTFVVQENLRNVEDTDKIENALKTTEVAHFFIKVIPFLYDYVEGEPWEGFFNTLPVFAFGSTTLLRISQNKKWSPGVLSGNNFNYQNYINQYGKEMLNFEAEFYRFKDIPSFTGLKFMRPVHDNKEFAGTMVDCAELDIWKKRSLEVDVSLFPETPVLLADPIDIIAEYRLFIVNKKVITGSLYRADNRTYLRQLTNIPPDKEVVDYAQTMIDIYQPADAFVMDIARISHSNTKLMKIIEINSINASGFYESDVSKVLLALQEFYS